MSKKVLFLGDEHSPLLIWLRNIGEDVVQTSEKLSVEWVSAQHCQFLISYGYRYILSDKILSMFEDRAINLHISYLPWNRGADPNFWSFVDGTPKGVSIHYLDQGVDTGDIIAQQQIEFDIQRHTLESSYQILQDEIQALFKSQWRGIKEGTCARTKQQEGGSLHKQAELNAKRYLLTQGWQTPLIALAQPIVR